MQAGQDVEVAIAAEGTLCVEDLVEEDVVLREQSVSVSSQVMTHLEHMHVFEHPLKTALAEEPATSLLDIKQEALAALRGDLHQAQTAILVAQVDTLAIKRKRVVVAEDLVHHLAALLHSVDNHHRVDALRLRGRLVGCSGRLAWLDVAIGAGFGRERQSSCGLGNCSRNKLRTVAEMLIIKII
jgi:hypothetical protein